MGTAFPMKFSKCDGVPRRQHHYFQTTLATINIESNPTLCQILADGSITRASSSVASAKLYNTNLTGSDPNVTIHHY